LDNLIQETGAIIDFETFQYQNYQNAPLSRNGKSYSYHSFGYIGRSNNNEQPKIFMPKNGSLIKAAINDRILNGKPIWCCLQAKDFYTSAVTETYIYSTIILVQLHQDNIILNLGTLEKSNGIFTYANQEL
jgi:hypothetical protein